jgi:hypothetical protein
MQAKFNYYIPYKRLFETTFTDKYGTELTQLLLRFVDKINNPPALVAKTVYSNYIQNTFFDLQEMNNLPSPTSALEHLEYIAQVDARPEVTQQQYYFCLAFIRAFHTFDFLLTKAERNSSPNHQKLVKITTLLLDKMKNLANLDLSCTDDKWIIMNLAQHLMELAYFAANLYSTSEKYDTLAVNIQSFFEFIINEKPLDSAVKIFYIDIAIVITELMENQTEAKKLARPLVSYRADKDQLRFTGKAMATKKLAPQQLIWATFEKASDDKSRWPREQSKFPGTGQSLSGAKSEPAKPRVFAPTFYTPNPLHPLKGTPQSIAPPTPLQDKINARAGAAEAMATPPKKPLNVNQPAAAKTLSVQEYQDLLQEAQDRQDALLKKYALPEKTPLATALDNVKYALQYAYWPTTYLKFHFYEENNETGEKLRTQPIYQEYKRELDIVNAYVNQKIFSLASQETLAFNALIQKYTEGPHPHWLNVGKALMAISIIVFISSILLGCIPAISVLILGESIIATAIVAGIFTTPFTGLIGVGLYFFASPSDESSRIGQSLLALKKEYDFLPLSASPARPQ